MLYSATLLIQDVQLICFTVVFGVLAFQRWSDRMRRWLWYSFLANAAGAGFDFLGARLPAWISHGINGEMIPLSYALLNIAIILFDRRRKFAGWVSGFFLFASLPFFLAWRDAPIRVRSDALGDLLIALECIVTVALLFASRERSTRAPRYLMGGFLIAFVGIELARFWVAFPLNGNPDVSTPRLALISAVSYIVNVSLLPLAFIWMMQARLESDLLQQSIVDPLTSVLNRRGLEQALDRELARFHRYGEDLTLAMLDLDHFKRVNDKHGHAAGDAILVSVARFLTRHLRETDVVGRYGGEEFVLLLSHADAAQAGPILEQLCRELSQCADLLPSTDLRVTASLGVASTSGRRTFAADDLLREADLALYDAKGNGRNQVCYFQPSGPAGTPRVAMPLP
jgi:diguanylate cyclase (GGDEF)-like protein